MLPLTLIMKKLPECYWKQFGPPPKVIKLNIGNCRIDAIELLLISNKDQIIQFVAGNNGLLVLEG